MLEAAMVQLATLETEIRTRLDAFEEELRSKVRILEDSRAREAQRRDELETENRALRKTVNTYLEGMKRLGAERDREKDRAKALFRILNDVLAALKPFSQAPPQWPPNARVICGNPAAQLTPCEFSSSDFERACETYRTVAKHPIMDLGNPAERSVELLFGPDIDHKTLTPPPLTVRCRVARLEDWIRRATVCCVHPGYCQCREDDGGGPCTCGLEALRGEIANTLREENPDAQP